MSIIIRKEPDHEHPQKPARRPRGGWQNMTAIVAAFRIWRIVHACIPAFVQDIAEAECIASPGVVSASS